MTGPGANRASDNHQPITQLDRLIVKLGDILSVVFLGSACIIVFEIVARYVFDSPTIWVHETTTLLCAICFLYAGSYCLACNRHIRIGLFYDAVSARVRRILDIFIAFLGLVYMLVLSWAAFGVANKALFAPWGAFRPETSGSAWDPALPAIVKTFLFCVVVLMLIQFLLQLIRLVVVGSPRDDHDV
ncbi:C4-dicarboxylate ABC transporter permease [Motiliproteus sp. MSK22-1]|nr:C4-dicarboxylate ABC transporter permease [Motiliproteus sp. MSK22-1]